MSHPSLNGIKFRITAEYVMSMKTPLLIQFCKFEPPDLQVSIFSELQSLIVLLFSPARPTFLSAPEDVIGAPGDTINIQCQVEGDPQPTVRWSKLDGDLPQGR